MGEFRSREPKTPEINSQIKIDLSEFGVKENRKIIELLSSMDRVEVKNIISAILDKISAVFLFDDTDSKEYMDYVIFKSLELDAFASHIKTPQDFHRYADKVIEIGKSILEKKKDSQDNDLVLRESDGSIYEYGVQVFRSKEIVVDAMNLVRDDFDRDLDTLLQMLHDNPTSEPRENILSALKNISNFIRNSDDLERVGRFVKLLSEHKFDAKKELAGQSIGWDEEDNLIKAPFLCKQWEDVITDSKKLDEVLSLMETVFSQGANPSTFINGVGRTLFTNATTEQLFEIKQIISSIFDEVKIFISINFNSPLIYGDENKDVVEQIFKSLELDVFASHIKTPQDFRHYVARMMEFWKLDLDININYIGAYSFSSSSYNMSSNMRKAVFLMRDDIDHDLDSLLQIMSYSKSLNYQERILGILKDFSGLIQTSKDLERFAQSIKSLSENGLQAELLFGGYRNDFSRKRIPSLFGIQNDGAFATDKELLNFKEWQKIITEGKKLNEVLAIFEVAFIRGTDLDDFIIQTSNYSFEQKKEFIDSTTEFAKKNIPPQFVVQNMDVLKNVDFSKDGLDIFTSSESKKRWLNYCAYLLTKNPRFVVETAQYFNEVLKSEIETTSGGELHAFVTEILETSIRSLFLTQNFETLNEIEQKITGTSTILSKIDQEYASTLTGDTLEKYISVRHNENFENEYDSRAPFKVNKVKFESENEIIASCPLINNPNVKKVAPATFSRIVQDWYKNIFSRAESDFSFSSGLSDMVDFKKIVDVDPSNELLQATYFHFLDKFIRIDKESTGEFYKNFLIDLSESVNIAPQFDKNKIMALYEFCLVSGEKFYNKLNVLEQITGFHIDAEFVKKYLLENRDFKTAVVYPISSAELDQHFSKTENTTQEEYKRIYQIFGCFDYYQNVIAELEKDKSLGAKQKMIEILAMMGIRDMENSKRYASHKEKIMTFVEVGGTSITKLLGKALSELAKNGDGDLLAYLTSIIRDRTRSTNDKNAQYGPIGLTSIQETALRTLFYVDSPASNERLLSLLFVDDIDQKVKVYILKNIVTDKPEFFPKKIRAWVLSELKTKKSMFSIEELKYFHAMLEIPNADLSKKSLQYSDEVFGDLKKQNISLSGLHREHFSSIPDNILLPLWLFVQGDEALLRQFNTIHKTIKSSSGKEVLLLGVVSALSIDKKILKKITNILSKLDLTADGNMEELGSTLKILSFLNDTDKYLNNFKTDILEIFNSQIISLVGLNDKLKKVVVENIKEILPYEGISSDAIQVLWEKWGNLEPIFTYASKMAEQHQDTLYLVAEMVAHMDPPLYDVWKSWRYNIQESDVKEQIGHLSEAQLEIWKNNPFAELGDIIIAETPADKPKQIINFIEGSLREGHIYNPDIDKNDRYKFIQEQLGEVHIKISKQPDQREMILNGAVELLQTDLREIDIIIRYGNLSKLEQIITFFSDDKNVPINAKTKSIISFLAQFVSNEQFKAIEKAYKEAEKSGATIVNSNSILTISLRQSLNSTVEEIKRDYESAIAGGIFDKYGLNREQIKNSGQFYQKRQELKALIDLYRISGLYVKRIATNRILARADKKGETLMSVIENLKIYFKDNQTFLQDIINIQSVISSHDNLSIKRHLAMVVTDNPQMVIQAGKYPLGCGSCQNYEGGTTWNKSLAGYVADAHTKVAYLIDINKLPDNLKLEISTKGFDQVKENIPPQDLLEASIARSVIKMTKTADKTPLLFVEPTYSPVNKSDLGMDRYFNIFLELMVSEPMGIRLARGGGKEIVSVPKSRNPNGQYEDCIAGNAFQAGMGIQTESYTMFGRFIDKFTPTNEEDRKMADRISRK